MLIDWQNSYSTARALFFDDTAFHTKGQFDPWALGQRIANLGVERIPRVLSQVRVYRGAPDPRVDRKSAAAQQRQAVCWESRSPDLKVKRRALRYPRGWPGVKAEEKGVDVQLAIDLVAGYLRGGFDVAVALSRDTDLVPALELACEIADHQHLVCPEVATWTRNSGKGIRLTVKGQGLRCHWLTRDDYSAVQDDTDYNIPQNQKPRQFAPRGEGRGLVRPGVCTIRTLWSSEGGPGFRLPGSRFRHPVPDEASG